MTDDNTVSLRVNGLDFSGWLEVSITAGIERLARDFRLSVTERWPGSGEAARKVRPGDLCELRIGNDLVLTGWVDATPVQYDGASITHEVSGRSRTGDLVDCSAIHAPGQWRGVPLMQIAADLASPYGVQVSGAVGDRVTEHQIEQGESVSESLDRLLKPRQLWATDDAQGRLVLLRVGELQATTALKLGDNILTGSIGNDYGERFSEYICKGQHSPGDDFPAGQAAGASGRASDPQIKRRRVLVLQQTGQATAASCAERVAFEQAYRAAKSRAATYQVGGWRQADGTLWQPNMRVRVNDPLSGIDDEYLISEVEYSLSDSGMLCTLQVAPAAAFMRESDEQDQKAAKSGKGDKAGGKWGDIKPLGQSVNNQPTKPGKSGGWGDIKK